MKATDMLIICRGLLQMYTHAHGTWWQRLFSSDYTPTRRTDCYFTSEGFCTAITYYIKYRRGSVRVDFTEVSKILDYLFTFTNYKYSRELIGYWFDSGKRAPRIKLLKRAIKALETEIEIHGYSTTV